MKPTATTLLGAILLCASLLAQNLADLEKRVTEFTLRNGMHFIVMERRDAPVVSFHTYVNAGSANDPSGATGIAHMFEHMAFKGTDQIGTTNYALESQALAAIERLRDEIAQEERKGKKADRKRLESLQADLRGATEKANSFVVPNDFPQIIEQNGGSGLNASTGMDSTNYYYSLPSNRVELWFLLESERFRKPVYREFYKERDVVREERRMRTESSPQGRLVEQLLTMSFAAHPYGQPPVGWASDIENLRVADAERFYQTHYVPGNITVAIVGDVDPAEVKALAAKYFERLPGGPAPPPIHTAEPEQIGERRASVQGTAQPFLAIAYKRPDQNHPDDIVFDVTGMLLSSGRTGMLYKDLVRDRKLSLVAQAIPSFPGGKYPNLFVLFLVPNLSKTVAENEAAAYEIIEKLKTDPVEKVSLDRVKTKVRASVVRQLDNNRGLAAQLASYHVNYGDWRMLYRFLEDLDKVTAEDVQRVAREYFQENRRTVVYLQQKAAGKGGAQ